MLAPVSHSHSYCAHSFASRKVHSLFKVCMSNHVGKNAHASRLFKIGIAVSYDISHLVNGSVHKPVAIWPQGHHCWQLHQNKTINININAPDSANLKGAGSSMFVSGFIANETLQILLKLLN